jgi:hypothetical protein
MSGKGGDSRGVQGWFQQFSAHNKEEAKRKRTNVAAYL